MFVLGVSGATWHVLQPLIESGRAPAFAQLCREGCRGTLRSVRVEGDEHYRPQAAWATIATGCMPERHGITRFFHTDDDLLVPTLWDRFAGHGLAVGVHGWPPSWPPRPTNGFVIPSHLARDARTWPPDLTAIKALDRSQQSTERERGAAALLRSAGQALPLLRRHGVRARTLPLLARALGASLPGRDPEQRALVLRHAKLELGADTFAGLFRRFRPCFSSFHTFLVDFVSHRYWRYFEPESFPGSDGRRFAAAVPEAYVRVDRVLSRLLRALPRETVVFVLSEHGMRAEPDSPELGHWRYVIRGLRVARLAGLGDEVLACPVARWVAYRSPPGGELPPDTAARLRGVTVVETGLPLFQVVEHGPDEVVVQLDLDRRVRLYRETDLEDLRITVGAHTVPFLEVTARLGRRRSAMHDEDGILLVGGPGIRRGAVLQPSRLVDVAPTVLQAAGLPVPEGLDGHALPVFAEQPGVGLE